MESPWDLPQLSVKKIANLQNKSNYCETLIFTKNLQKLKLPKMRQIIHLKKDWASKFKSAKKLAKFSNPYVFNKKMENLQIPCMYIGFYSVYNHKQIFNLLLKVWLHPKYNHCYTCLKYQRINQTNKR